MNWFCVQTYILYKLKCIYRRSPKIHINRKFQPLKASTYWVKTKMTQRMNSDGGLLPIHSKKHLLLPKLDKYASFFKSHKRCSDYHLTLRVRRCPSLLWHHSCHSLSVTRRPWWWRTSCVRHWRDPPGDCHRLGDSNEWTGNVLPSVRPYVRLLPTLGIIN